MSNSLKLVDELIALVKSPSTSSCSSSSAQPAASASSSSSSSASAVGVVNGDVAWFPVVPVGHTEFSWLGEDYVSNGQIPSAVSLSAPATPAPATATAAEGEKKTAKAQEQKTGKAEEQKNSKDKKEKEPKDKEKAAVKVAEKKSGKKDKEGAAAEAAAYEASRAPVPLLARLDVRVGRVLKAWNHPKADRLYIEEIDVGEEKPRQVISGLRNKIPLEEFVGARLLVCCNLQPAKMVGETSFGMVLAASNDDHSVVELVSPSEGVKEGTRVTVEGIEVEKYEADKEIDGKAEGSVWRRIAEKLVTNDQGVATWDGKALLAGGKVCRVKSLHNKKIG